MSDVFEYFQDVSEYCAFQNNQGLSDIDIVPKEFPMGKWKCKTDEIVVKTKNLSINAFR